MEMGEGVLTTVKNGGKTNIMTFERANHNNGNYALPVWQLPPSTPMQASQPQAFRRTRISARRTAGPWLIMMNISQKHGPMASLCVLHTFYAYLHNMT